MRERSLRPGSAARAVARPGPGPRGLHGRESRRAHRPSPRGEGEDPRRSVHVRRRPGTHDRGPGRSGDRADRPRECAWPMTAMRPSEMLGPSSRPLLDGFSSAVYGLVLPETRAMTRRLWAEQPDILFEWAYEDSQDQAHLT